MYQVHNSLSGLPYVTVGGIDQAKFLLARLFREKYLSQLTSQRMEIKKWTGT
jgi:hypothetical protein